MQSYICGATAGSISMAVDEFVRRKREMAGRKSGKQGKLGHEIRKLNARTEEEVDALKADLFQADERPSGRDGSGRVVDELAEAKLARFTEVGPLEADRGAESLTPGRDDTSATLRRHYPNTGVARAESAADGNLDETREENRVERKVDEGTAA